MTRVFSQDAQCTTATRHQQLHTAEQLQLPDVRAEICGTARLQMRNAAAGSGNAADVPATGPPAAPRQQDRFTYTFDAAAGTWTHPAMDPAVVAAASAAAASAAASSDAAPTLVKVTYSTAPQQPPRQRVALTYTFDAARNTWTHPGMDPAAMEAAAAAAAAKSADSTSGRVQITHVSLPPPLQQPLVSHTYGFDAASGKWVRLGELACTAALAEAGRASDQLQFQPLWICSFVSLHPDVSVPLDHTNACRYSACNADEKSAYSRM